MNTATGTDWDGASTATTYIADLFYTARPFWHPDFDAADMFLDGFDAWAAASYCNDTGTIIAADPLTVMGLSGPELFSHGSLHDDPAPGLWYRNTWLGNMLATAEGATLLAAIVSELAAAWTPEHHVVTGSEAFAHYHRVLREANIAVPLHLRPAPARAANHGRAHPAEPNNDMYVHFLQTLRRSDPEPGVATTFAEALRSVVGAHIEDAADISAAIDELDVASVMINAVLLLADPRDDEQLDTAHMYMSGAGGPLGRILHLIHRHPDMLADPHHMLASLLAMEEAHEPVSTDLWRWCLADPHECLVAVAADLCGVVLVDDTHWPPAV